MIFTEVRSDDNNRLTVTINQAYKVRLFPPLLRRIRLPQQANRELGTANTLKQSRCYLNPVSGVDCR